MGLLTRSGRLGAVNADGPQWVVPTRVALGVLLLCPIDGSIQQLFTFYHADRSALSFGVAAADMLLRAVEILAGMSFVAGPIEKQTARGTTRYAVALGSGNQKQELLIDEGGKVIASNAGEDDDD